MRRSRVLYLFVLVAVLVIVLMAITGGPRELLSYTCRRDAEAMGLNWAWSPVRGCFVQQPNGSWVPIDSFRHYGQ